MSETKLTPDVREMLEAFQRGRPIHYPWDRLLVRHGLIEAIEADGEGYQPARLTDAGRSALGRGEE